MPNKSTDETNILLREISTSLKTTENIAKRSSFKNQIESLGFKFGVKNVQTQKRRESSHAREKNTLLKIIIGMAIDFYGYDALASKSPLPKELEATLDELGISVSRETIRNKLKEAAEFLPAP